MNENDLAFCELAARFWHWYGRVGSEGRMPVSLSVEAMMTADAMFESLGERRHRHSCQRHLAEVEDVDDALQDGRHGPSAAGRPGRSVCG